MLGGMEKIQNLFQLRMVVVKGKFWLLKHTVCTVRNCFTILLRKQSGCWVLGYYRGIFGYSDDNWLLAPSLSALQDMLKTCEDYAMTHNLKFSTDPDPKKCKTKCMAFFTKPKKLSNVYLCGNPLPWVDSLKHLGNMVSNQIDGGQIDGHEDKDGQIH